MTDSNLTLVQATLELPPTETGSDLPTRFRLFTAPLFTSTKGTFIFDSVAAESVMARHATWGNQLSGDYEHQALNPNLTGPIPASFWADIALDEAGNLDVVNVRWTPVAAQALRNKEYRYFSPAFLRDENMRILELVNVALTNIPSELNQTPLIAASRRRGIMTDTTESTPVLQTANLANVPPPDPLLVLCNVGSHSEALPLVLAWKASHEALPTVQAELASMRAQVVDGQKKAMIAQLDKEGKSTPNQEAFLLGLSLEQLSSYAATAPVIRPRTEAKDPHIPPPAAVQGSAQWAGLSMEQLAKSKDFEMLNRLALENPSLHRQLQAFKKAAKAAG